MLEKLFKCNSNCCNANSCCIKQPSVAKLNSAIGDVKDEVRTVGTKADLYLGALSDALVVQRRARVSEQLAAMSVPQAQWSCPGSSPILSW